MLWFEISKMLIAVLKSKFIGSFIIIFGTLSFPISRPSTTDPRLGLSSVQVVKKDQEGVKGVLSWENRTADERGWGS